MPHTTKVDSLDEALRIVDVEYGGKLEPPPVLAEWPPFGDLVPLDTNERAQLEAIAKLVARFAREPAAPRPLCLAVFGPPGSGKSFAVNQIVASDVVRASLPPDAAIHTTTINLTQVTNAGELAGALYAGLTSARKGEIPLLFFDEFDAPREGAPYGWLSWFLAPMHDGEFLLGARSVPVTRAIFAFAGGTAATMAEFSERRSDRTFREAKGPDFVSRLRGYLDVAGPNANPRTLRRAYVLRGELQKRVRRVGAVSVRFERETLKAMLQAGRYRHGARSIAALVDLSEIGASPVGWDMLPDDQLVDLFVDRGPLDPRAIGGSIVLSGFGTAPDAAPDAAAAAVHECWTAVAAALWNEGATLAYAGHWHGHLSNLTKLLSEELSKRPPELRRAAAARSNPTPPRFRSYLDGLDLTSARAEVDDLMTEADRARLGIELVVPAALSVDERVWLGGSVMQRWQARTLERFRRRLASSEESVARFVVGGRVDRKGDRVSGVIQEAILSLALGHPIYVAGGFGGAARDLGVVLGLDRLRTGEIPPALLLPMDANKRDALIEIAARLRPPPHYELPVLPEEFMEFVRGRALGGAGWPANGLTVDENRTLFHSTDALQVQHLVTTGLRRCFDRG